MLGELDKTGRVIALWNQIVALLVGI